MAGRLAAEKDRHAVLDVLDWLWDFLAEPVLAALGADHASSGFVLQDGTLTVADLAALPGGQRDMAFLSACETAAGSVRHLDEAIHLAGALHEAAESLRRDDPTDPVRWAPYVHVGP